MTGLTLEWSLVKAFPHGHSASPAPPPQVPRGVRILLATINAVDHDSACRGRISAVCDLEPPERLLAGVSVPLDAGSIETVGLNERRVYVIHDARLRGFQHGGWIQDDDRKKNSFCLGRCIGCLHV